MEDLNDKITGGTLTAEEWNQVPSEMQNIIQALNIALDGGDLNQLGKAICGYVANGNYYSDSGSVNAYVLTQIGSKQAAPEYSDGMNVRFKITTPNNSSSTINVSGLGIKDIRDENGGVLVGGELDGVVNLSYNATSDYFEILELGGGGATGGGSDEIFYLNGQSVTQDFTVPDNNNAMTAGPVITIDGTAVVTLDGNSNWIILG